MLTENFVSVAEKMPNCQQLGLDFTPAHGQRWVDMLAQIDERDSTTTSADHPIYVLYGSSEVAADATWYPTWHGYNSTRASVPIGRPIAHTQAIIVNRQMPKPPARIALAN